MEDSTSTARSAWKCPNCSHHYQIDEYQPTFLPSAHLYRTNEVLPISQQPAALELVQTVENDLSLMNLEVQRLQDTLKALEIKKARIQDHLQSTKSLLAPVRWVPRDIIGEILLHAVGTYEPDRNEVSLDTRRAPWTYTQVCRLWREELLSRPSIWAHVNITDGPRRFMRPDLCATVLERSKDHDLTLKFSVHSAKADMFLDIVIGHSPRWKTVSLTLKNKLLEKLEKLEHRIPRLTNLRILLAGEHIPRPPSVIVRSFEDAPALRSVSFDGIGQLHTMRLPWGKITHFSDLPPFHGFGVSSHGWTMLQLMQNLEHYDISLFQQYLPESESSQSPGTVTLSRLTSLYLREGAEHFGDVLPYLCLPALSTILFDLRIVINTTVLSSLIERSQCTITKLILSLEGMPNEDVLNLWKALPTLETVQFGIKPRSALFTALIDDSSILPKLNTIHFDAEFLPNLETHRSNEGGVIYLRIRDKLIGVVDKLVRARTSITRLGIFNGKVLSSYVERLKGEPYSLLETVEIVEVANDLTDIWHDNANGMWDDYDEEDDEGDDEAGGGNEQNEEDGDNDSNSLEEDADDDGDDEW